jgi:hypothetical protein
MIRRAAVFFVILVVGFAASLSMHGLGTTAQDSSLLPYQRTGTALAMTRTTFEETFVAQSTATHTPAPAEVTQTQAAINTAKNIKASATAEARTAPSTATTLRMETKTPTRSATKTPTATATPRLGRSIPKTACGGDDWLGEVFDLIGEMNEKDAALSAENADPSQFFILYQKAVFDVDVEEAPAALKAYAVTLSNYYERFMWYWDRIANGEAAGIESTEVDQMLIDIDHSLAAYDELCSTSFALNTSLWTGGDEPSSWGDGVCSDDWKQAALERAGRLVGRVDRAMGDAYKIQDLYYQAAEQERLSDPPLALVGLSLRMARYYEVMATSWNYVTRGYPWVLDSTFEMKFVADLELLDAAYADICTPSGTVG